MRTIWTVLAKSSWFLALLTLTVGWLLTGCSGERGLPNTPSESAPPKEIAFSGYAVRVPSSLNCKELNPPGSVGPILLITPVGGSPQFGLTLRPEIKNPRRVPPELLKSIWVKVLEEYRLSSRKEQTDLSEVTTVPIGRSLTIYVEGTSRNADKEFRYRYGSLFVDSSSCPFEMILPPKSAAEYRSLEKSFNDILAEVRLATKVGG